MAAVAVPLLAPAPQQAGKLVLFCCHSCFLSLSAAAKSGSATWQELPVPRVPSLAGRRHGLRARGLWISLVLPSCRCLLLCCLALRRGKSFPFRASPHWLDAAAACVPGASMGGHWIWPVLIFSWMRLTILSSLPTFTGPGRCIVPAERQQRQHWQTVAITDGNRCHH